MPACPAETRDNNQSFYGTHSRHRSVRRSTETMVLSTQEKLNDEKTNLICTRLSKRGALTSTCAHDGGAGAECDSVLAGGRARNEQAFSSHDVVLHKPGHDEVKLQFTTERYAILTMGDARVAEQCAREAEGAAPKGFTHRISALHACVCVRAIAVSDQAPAQNTRSTITRLGHRMAKSKQLH